MTDHAPWLLVAPWYRWPVPRAPQDGRLTRPVFQKYDTAKLVAAFVKDPQRSLKFTDEDFVHRMVRGPFLSPFPGHRDRKRRLTDLLQVRTDTRKLFLDTHKRFYLVVCELHCDAAGLPNVPVDHVCEAGFVVRRRTVTLGTGTTSEAAPLLDGIAAARGQVGASVRHQQAAVAKLLQEEERLRAWAAGSGLKVVLDRWLPTGFERVGQWTALDVNPDAQELIYPLYPLVPNRNDPGHSGGARMIYFGLVPTGAAETDPNGNPRFDDRSVYDIRCFVRRHKVGCPKKRTRGDCHGDLVWSAPTEPYQVAAHFDLVGTSHQPVTVQLPDLQALEAQAATLPPNQVAPFRMAAPPRSNLEFDVNPDTLARSNPARTEGICSFSIPLITIVATFVFKLFLPVVTFLFGLFFLLKLKFCIPPSVSVDAGVKASLAAAFGGVNAGLDFGAQIDIANQDATLAAVDADIVANFGPDVGTDLVETYDVGVLAHLEQSIADASEPENAPSVTATLEWEATVPVPARVA